MCSLKLGMRLRDTANNGKQIYLVADIFPAGQYPGMILEWIQDGRVRGQAFTTRDWQKRWEVVEA